MAIRSRACTTEWIFGRTFDTQHNHRWDYLISITSAMLFFPIAGTVASADGKPTGINTNGRSFFGRFRMFARNPMGLGGGVRLARPLTWSAARRNPVPSPTSSSTEERLVY